MYTCKCCSYETQYPTNLKSHLKTKKHIKRQKEIEDGLRQKEKRDTTETDELRELVFLLKEQVTSLSNELKFQSGKIEKLEKRLVESNGCSSQIINNFGNLKNENTTINLFLTDFSKSKLPESIDIVDILKGVNTCWSELLTKKYFNPNIPEQNNLRIVNQQKKTSKTYDGNKWNLTDTPYLIRQMVDDLSLELESRGVFEKFKENTSAFIQNRFKERYGKYDGIQLGKKDIRDIETALLSEQKKLKLSSRV